MSPSYDHYSEWKHWKPCDFAASSFDLQRSYDLLFRHLNVSLPGKKILEIGFGNGNFISYALSRGCSSIEGVEIQETLLSRALAMDLKVYSDLSQVECGSKFDIIVAFNVLEHLSSDELVALFTSLDNLLPCGGICIFEFPNGESFFSLGMQNGDITHVSSITRQKLYQLMTPTSLNLKFWFPAYHHLDLISQSRLTKLIQSLFKRLFVKFLGYNDISSMYGQVVALIEKE